MYFVGLGYKCLKSIFSIFGFLHFLIPYGPFFQIHKASSLKTHWKGVFRVLMSMTLGEKLNVIKPYVLIIKTFNAHFLEMAKTDLRHLYPLWSLLSNSQSLISQNALEGCFSCPYVHDPWGEIKCN